MDANANDSTRPERKIIEKNRRNLIKRLFSNLASLVIPSQPNASSTAMVSSQNDQLDLAISYIPELKERIQSLKNYVTIIRSNNAHHSRKITCNLALVIEDRDSSSTVDIIFINESKSNLMLSGVVRVLEEEGVEVVNASFSSARDREVYFTIHSQIKSARIGVELPRLRQRLAELLHGSSQSRQTSSTTSIIHKV